MEDQEEQAKKVSLLKTCIQPEQWVVIKELQKDGNQFSMVWKVPYKVVKMKPNLVLIQMDWPNCRQKVFKEARFLKDWYQT